MDVCDFSTFALALFGVFRKLEIDNYFLLAAGVCNALCCVVVKRGIALSSGRRTSPLILSVLVVVLLPLHGTVKTCCLSDAQLLQFINQEFYS